MSFAGRGNEKDRQLGMGMGFTVRTECEKDGMGMENGLYSEDGMGMAEHGMRQPTPYRLNR
jgi:hypothetical protein